MIYTISKKEGHQTVNEFLLKHPEFKLVREAQLFPYEDLDTALYYAVMKKETPLSESRAPLRRDKRPQRRQRPVSAASSD
jgi:hypothetical protein